MQKAVIAEYEVFKNDAHALAFFFYRQNLLDGQDQGPFYFNIQGDQLVAGAQLARAVFESVDLAVLSTARERGVVMLVEFEGQQPVRCTPCYYSQTF